MQINFSVKNKFIVNGKEYDSVEEMPDEIRDAYEKAIAGSPQPGHGGTHAMEGTKVVFNGKEYPSEDAMPQEERELYKVVMKAMEKEGVPMPGGIGGNMPAPWPDTRTPGASGKPIVPESSFSPRKWFSFAAILVLLAGAAYLLLAFRG